MSGIVIPPGIALGEAPDRQSVRDAFAILAARRDGFLCQGTLDSNAVLFFRRFRGDYVDLMSLVTDGDRPSCAARYNVRGYPWPRHEWPESLRDVYGDIADVVAQVLDWP